MDGLNRRGLLASVVGVLATLVFGRAKALPADGLPAEEFKLKSFSPPPYIFCTLLQDLRPGGFATARVDWCCGSGQVTEGREKLVRVKNEFDLVSALGCKALAFWVDEERQYVVVNAEHQVVTDVYWDEKTRSLMKKVVVLGLGEVASPVLGFSEA